MSWEDSAACRAVPFFTELPPGDAKRMCMVCPVVDACLRDALAIELETWHGSKGYLATVRGGLSVNERVKMLRAQQVNVAGRLVMRQSA